MFEVQRRSSHGCSGALGRQVEPAGRIARAFARLRASALACLLGLAVGGARLAAQTSEAGDRHTQEIPGTSVSFELAYLSGGSFRIGSPPDEIGRDEDEGPRRAVTIDPFWIGTTEVTSDVYSIFRDRRLDTEAGAAPDLPFDADAVTRPSPPYEDPSHGMGGPGRPATGMTRLAALRFARWLSEKTGRLYRLPTEAEWEYACRAGLDDPYGLDTEEQRSTAEMLEAHAWFAANSDGSLRDVGTRAPNRWGIHDLLGNAAEWTLDPYAPDFYASLPSDGSAANPSTGPSARGRGVVRGGAFDDDLPRLRCADRFEETPRWKRRDPQIPKSRWWNTDSPHVGFRLVSPAEPLSADEIRAYWEGLLGTD
jgi:formylglycine-generating enzyme required for sulfatase activity